MSTIIIDRDTCTMVLDSAELTADRVRPCVDAIADAVETALEADGLEGVEVGIVEHRPPVGGQGRSALIRARQLAEGGRDRDFRADVIRTDRAGGEAEDRRDAEEADGSGGRGGVHGGEGKEVQGAGVGNVATGARRRSVH